MTASAVLVAGCNREPAQPIDQSATVAVDDERIATYVQARYQRDSSVRGNDINVSARNGVVTLRGTVADAAAREQAVELAREVEGVQRVENELQVAPAAAADGTPAIGRPVEGGDMPARAASDQASPGWITTKIQSQYFVNPEVRPWNIDVTTSSDGSVTLRGEVEEAADRDEAVRIARETEGVTRVDDQLRVRADSAERTDTAEADRATVAGESPDEWITAKVQAKYFMDTDVKGRNINVDTRDGVVTLTGEVESEGERRQAVAIARNTDGVQSVNDQLRMERTEAAADTDANRTDADNRPAEREVSTGIDDAWITTKVQAKFFLDDDIKGRDINVDAREGIVYLKGTVESDAEKRVAETIALETDGVSRVENQLKVDAAAGRR